MFRRPTKEINAEFPAEERFLDSIQQIVREACAAAGMPRKQLTAVQLAIEEGATNIIRHAYLYEKGTIRVRIVIYKRMLAFSLIDTGRSFQPDRQGKVDLEKLVASGRRGGLGFYMVQKIMDSVEYISSAGQNELRMIKRLEGGDDDSPPLLRRMFTLRVKFSIWTLIIVALIVGGAYWYLNTFTYREHYSHLDETARALGATIADQAGVHFINNRTDVEFDELAVSYRKANPFIEMIVITDSNNVVKAHSSDPLYIRKPYEPPDYIPEGTGDYPRRFERNNEQMSYISLPVKSGKNQLGSVYMLYTAETIQAKLDQAKETTLWLTLALVGVGILGIFVLSSYFVTPIVKITNRVRRFSKGDLETELPLEGADEFFEISRALNEIMARLNRDRKDVIAREKMAKEIEVASQIQKTLLPTKLPGLRGAEVDAFYRAASMVGGDLYDVFQIKETRYCFVIADVSGKGVPASLLMSMLRTVIQISARSADSARGTLISVNNYLTENMPPGMFITVLLAFYDTERRTFQVVSAGHNPLLHYQKATDEIRQINPAGMPLGMPTTIEKSFEEAIEEIEVPLAEGDCLLLYTDGITEATNRDGEQYGVDRLISYFRSRVSDGQDRSIIELSRGLVDELDTFSGFARQNDDITFMIIRTTDAESTSGERPAFTSEIDVREISSGADSSSS